jgi:polyisoprenoid-binding protein YceI
MGGIMSAQLAAAVLLPAVGRYQVVPSQSTLSFAVRKLGLFTVHGMFSVAQGRAEVNHRVTITGEVDAASFTTAI